MNEATMQMFHFKNYQQFVAVEGYSIDHAVKRLTNKWPNSTPLEWDLLEELEPEHFVGAMGIDLPLPVNEIRRN